MSIIPAVGAEVTIGYTIAGQEDRAFSVFGVGNETGKTAEEIGGSVAAAWGTDLMPVLCDNVTFVTIRVEFASGELFEASVSDPGGDSNSACPSNVTYLVKKTSAAAGRRNRGRMYLPGVDETHVDGAGNLDGAIMGDVQDALDTLRTEMAADDNPMMIFHSTLPSIPTLVNSLELQPKVATQRRRLR